MTKPSRTERRVFGEPLSSVVLAVAVSAVVTLIGWGLVGLILIAIGVVGLIVYIRVADWLEYRRARPDLARPLFPGRRQGGLANGGGAATMGKDQRQSEDRG